MAGETPTIGSLLDTLAPRENQVVRKSFGIETDRLTPEKIGRDLPRETIGTDGRVVGLSVARVLGIKARALRKLQHPARSRLLKLIIESDNTPVEVLDLAREIFPPQAPDEADSPSPKHGAKRPPIQQREKLIVMPPR